MITAFTRTIILYVLIITGLRLMGKRQIGELEPGELVLTMMLSDLATVPMQDLGIPLAAGLIPIAVLLSLSMLLSQLSLQSIRFRDLVCGTPAVLIKNGVVQQQVMRKNRYTLDELLEELRQQGYCTVSEIKYAILENSGQVSLLPWPRCQPPDTQDQTTLPVVLINDGRVLQKNLSACGLDRTWLDRQLRAQGLSSPRDAFLLTVDELGAVQCIPKEDT